MKAAGIEVVRIAEFAWTVFEPKENEFSFSLFDAFMDLALEEDMKVIFCTPTATPPVWMSHRYPEILNMDKDGHRIGHGHRRHSNLTSERFCTFSAPWMPSTRPSERGFGVRPTPPGRRSPCPDEPSRTDGAIPIWSSCKNVSSRIW